ncbi:MAG: hypothetical protein Fur0046_04260 [Cyanobacteria bacterium J069]
MASGVRVGLEVGEDGKQPELESPGWLPQQPRLLEYLDYWQRCYRQLPAPTRLRPKQVSYTNSVKSCVQSCLTAADYLKQALSYWLDSRDFRHLKEDLLCELKRNDTVRVLIHTPNALLAQLPWHLWDFFDRYPNTELAFSAPGAQRARPSLAAPPSGRVRVLAILGNSSGIDVATDRALLESMPYADVTFLVEPSRRDISDRLFEQTWDILFFAGHSESSLGTATGDRGRIFINQLESLAIADLKASLDKAVQRGLKLAILNSCNGLGLAQDLRQLNIPQLIVMREPVPDRIAQEFLKYFLSAFSGGTSLYLSVREARQRLGDLESDFPCASWLPVIFQNRAEMPPTWKDLRGESLLGSITPPEANILPPDDTFSHSRQMFSDPDSWHPAIPGNSEWRTISFVHSDALPPKPTPMQDVSQPAASAQPGQPVTPQSAAAPVPLPNPIAPERTAPEYSEPQQEAKPETKLASGVEASAAPLTWLPEEVLPIGDALGFGPVSDQATVKDAIHPGYTGWVLHEGIRWKACLDLPWRQLYLPVEAPVRVLGRLDGTNMLIVAPLDPSLYLPGAADSRDELRAG